ncbi:hypothetical protein ACFOU2_20865 [Bacillus songklensis]|uniref:Uncharacterized protein n=1 Tax=Bacillus songklensis TaxID=1069116 RepID=A0ABV8B9G1_9BACI
MGTWNNEAAPNNNLPAAVIRSSKLVSRKKQAGHEFSEELADGGERDEAIEHQRKNE